MKEMILMEYFNTLVMEEGDDAAFILGKQYELLRSTYSDEGTVRTSFYFIDETGCDHHFDGPGIRDSCGFSMDDYFRVVDPNEVSK